MHEFHLAFFLFSENHKRNSHWLHLIGNTLERMVLFHSFKLILSECSNLFPIEDDIEKNRCLLCKKAKKKREIENKKKDSLNLQKSNQIILSLYYEGWEGGPIN